MWSNLFTLVGLLPLLVCSLATTDSIRDGDQACSGYSPSHNIDKNVVNSTAFGLLWTNNYGKLEKWYGRPLVYTSPAINGGLQIVFLASSQNIIRTVDAKTGKAILTRQLLSPFLQSDIGCTDIPNYIGIIGTPVIDPASDTVYLFAKGYKGGAAGGGVANGVYQFYAISLLDLSDRSGFPVLVDGHYADNDPTRYFLGGTVLQRPALTLVNNVVYGAFGGHCDLFNYTGMVVGVSTTPNVGVVTIYAMETSPYAAPVVPDITIQTGGKAGIWQSGFGLSSDGGRLFLATGNGQGHQNQGSPASGRILLDTLDECVVNLAIAPDGKLTLSDYFEPYEYLSLDAADRDLGSSGVTLLDPTVFKGAGVNRMAVALGKNGKAYIMNADNLGGYKNGPGGNDGIIQTITTSGAIFAGAGSYPGEGGYIYFTPVGSPTYAYKLGHDASGNPLFSQVGVTYRSYGATPGISNAAGRVGPGIPTITTFNGQAGTALLWRTDPDGGLQVFSAVPDASGYLQQIPISPTGGLNKFLRPAFGDGRLYVSDSNGNVLCLGSPVAVPLQCNAPVNFGDLAYGSSATMQVNCTAQIAITSIAGLKSSDSTWLATNSSLPTGSLTAGQSFMFPVTWDLTRSSIQNAQNASFGAVAPGIKTGVVTVFTNNRIAGYVGSYPISLTGNAVSQSPFLEVSPGELDFAGLVLGSVSASSGIPASFIITNAGVSVMTITGYAFASDLDSPVSYTNTSSSSNGTVIGPDYTSSDLPAVGSKVQPGTSITVSALFRANEVGQYSNILRIWSDGGNQYILMSGNAVTVPIATLSIETAEGGWDPNPVMDFGVVTAGSVKTRRVRICNSGGSPLTVTKSKPPIQTELKAENPTGDLHEGQVILVDACAYGSIDIAATPESANIPDHTVSGEWILNTDDIKFGVHNVQITATIRSLQVGPTYPNGSAIYEYLGCYFDGGGRQLQQQYDFVNNTNDYCTKLCSSKGYTFAGTEYYTQCWCGNNAPRASNYSDPSLKSCNFVCPGDPSQMCGGNPSQIGIFYNSQIHNPGCDSLPCPSSSSSVVPRSSLSSLSTLTTASSNTISSTTVGISSSTLVKNLPTKVNPSVTSSSTSTFSKSLLETSNSSSAASSPSSSTTASNFTVAISSTSSISSASRPASTIVSATQSSSSSKILSSPSFTPTATDGYISRGCYAEPRNSRALPTLLLGNDTMNVEKCISLAHAALPSRTYGWIGLEYSRECWGATAAPPTPTAYVGSKACPMLCKGNLSETCGGAGMFNLYVTTASANLSSASVATVTLGTLSGI